MRLKIFGGKRDSVLLVSDKKQRYDDADGLRQCRPERRAGCAKTEYPDKQIVQGNICRACNRNEIHRAFGIPHAPEYGADDVIGRDKRNADKADRKIGYGISDGFCGRGQNGGNGFYGKKQQSHKKNGQK